MAVINDITTELVFQVLLTLIVGYTLLKLVNYLVYRFADYFSSKNRLKILSFLPLFRLVTAIIILIMILRILLNPNETDLLAIAGASALAIGFAFKDYLSNILAGIIVIYEMPFRPGDWIEVQGTYGEVVSVGLRVLELRTPDDTIVRFPQSTFWNTPIFNSSGGQQDLMCVVNFYLNPKHTPDKVIEILKNVIITSPYTQLKKSYTVVLSEKPGYTHYKVKAYPIDSRNQFQFISDITIRAKNGLISSNIDYYMPMALDK